MSNTHNLNVLVAPFKKIKIKSISHSEVEKTELQINKEIPTTILGGELLSRKIKQSKEYAIEGSLFLIMWPEKGSLKTIIFQYWKHFNRK